MNKKFDNGTIQTIEKKHTQENIAYFRVNDQKVRKCHYDKNGKKLKEKEIDVTQISQNRRHYRDVDEFFEEMIWNHGYERSL